MGTGIKMKILIAAYYFPPIGGAGAQRPLKFAKYLLELGWSVTVITKSLESGANRWQPTDTSLTSDMERLNEKFEVIRVPNEPTSTTAGQIDPYENWAVNVGHAVSELLETNPHDAIMFTMSPFSLVRAAEIVRAKIQIPIILDFRDPWAFDGWQVQKSYIHWRKLFAEMSNALSHADGVIANTSEVGRLFSTEFSHMTDEKLEVIENGYDAEDFEEVPLHSFSKAPEKIKLVFTGSLCTDYLEYYSGLKGVAKKFIQYSAEKIDYSGRTLVPILKALEVLQSSGNELGFKFQIHCYGVFTEADRQSVSASGLEDIVFFHGYVPHKESIHKICNADALFLPLHGLGNGCRSRIVPGKTYEYLATGRPILGCLPEGDARDLVMQSENGFVADPCDYQSIIAALEQLSKKVESSNSSSASNTFVKRYERRELTVRLASFVKKICTLYEKRIDKTGSNT